MKFKIKVASFIAEIKTKYDYSYKMCKDFLTDEEAKVFIEITDSDIEYEKSLDSKILYPDYAYEFSCVYRKLMDEICLYDTILMHGSAICFDGSSHLFIAKSGTGKSTHTKLLLKYVKDSYIINDDKPLIRFNDGIPYIYGTPWAGKENSYKNESVPLKSIIILNRCESNEIKEIDAFDNYMNIMKALYLPRYDEEKMNRTLSTFDKLLSNVRVYSLYCNMDIDAAKTSYNVLKGER